MTNSGSSFAHQMFSPAQLRAYLLNTFYGFPLTAYVASAPHLPLSYFLTSVSPLPGSLTSWYEINAQMRVNAYIPYNAIGELLNYGWYIAVLVSFLLGAVLTAIDVDIRRRLRQREYLLPTVYIGLTVLFLLSTTQYNLRSSTRLLYYMMAISFLAWMFRALRPVGQRGNGQAAERPRPRWIARPEQGMGTGGRDGTERDSCAR
jgi:hypothetical protein